MGGARRLGSREDARAKPFAEHLRDSYIRAEFRSIDDHAKPGRSTDPNRSYDRGDMQISPSTAVDGLTRGP